MFAQLLTVPASSRRKKRLNRREPLELVPLEERRLLSSADLTTAATVTTVTNGVVVVQPMKEAYASNADSVKVGFTTSDPDDLGSVPTTHFNVTDTTTGTVVINNGTGTSFALSQQGVYQVQFWSTDSDDSEPVDAHSILIAVDRAAPTITIDMVNPSVLWPPNGKFVTVTVTGVASDSPSGVNASSLGFHVIDEYGKVEPSGVITSVTPTGSTPFGGYAQVGFSFQVMLQARRYGFDRDGRHYVIEVSADDMAGNTGVGSAVVNVPHDMGRPHGFHKTGQGGNATGSGVTDNGHGSHGHHNHHGKTGSGGSQVGAGSSSSGGTTTVGRHPGSRGDQGDKGNGHDQGQGHGNGNGNGNGNDQGQGHGNGNGKGNGNGNGNGNNQGQGHGNGNGKGKGNG